MRRLLAAVASVVVACAVGVVDEPAPEEDDDRPPDAAAMSAPVADAGGDAGAPMVTQHCDRLPTTKEITLPDGGRTSVVVFAECREVPEHDLGDPPPR